MVAMVNAGWSEDDCWSQLLDPANAGGAHFQAMHARNKTRARLTHTKEFEKARRWVAQNPVSDPRENTMKLIELRNLISDRPDLFSRGRAGTTERALVRRMVEVGIEDSSMVVRRSCRELAEDIDIRPSTVSAALRRLRNAGNFVKPYKSARGGKSSVHLLVLPRARTTVTGGLVPPAPEEFTVSVVGGQVHRLFGAEGLPLGALETLARLPQRESARRVPAGGGSPARGEHRGSAPVARGSAGNNRTVCEAHCGKGTTARGLPEPPVRHPPTAAELAREKANKSSGTVMRHLRRMQQYGMVQQNGDGTWERLPFDADALADALGIPDTVAVKKSRHECERASFTAQRIEWCEEGVAMGRLNKSVGRGKVIYSGSKSGVVVEEFTDDTMYRNLANRRAV